MGVLSSLQNAAGRRQKRYVFAALPQQKVRAALPPHTAVRLCLTETRLDFLGGYASTRIAEAQPRQNGVVAPERRSLSAMCGGKAASRSNIWPSTSWKDAIGVLL